MYHPTLKSPGILILANCLLLLLAQSVSAAEQSEVGIWESSLRNTYFGTSEIEENNDIIQIEAPKRAEDPALLPLKIKTGIPQSEQHYIKSVSLIIDRNPDPLAGVFHFTPDNGKADLELRVRLDQYSHVRAIAEMNDGKLYMTSRYVKGSGGCSAPAAGDLAAAMARLGKIKLQTGAPSADTDSPLVSAMLRISHPNITGMQKNQMTQLFYPSHYVQEVKVKLDDKPIFSAELGISISENPSFLFYLSPEQSGRLTAEIRDSEDLTFVHTEEVRIKSVKGAS
ncbi:MAG: quinoprotein dehydrogenase-associated SoxYZ-like carrier [Gammaproteobacteria bacterium]|nr:quinoprotein dehydrogenase-associated SoxYZ-like carrier [Gammaproteobacteria bacterium]